MEVRLKSETDSQVVWEWDPVQGARGFKYTHPNGRRSHTWNGAETEARFSKSNGVYLIEPLHVHDIGEAAYPPPDDPPPPPASKYPYGNILAATSLWNYPLGPQGAMAHQIVAQHTGRVESMGVWWKTTDPGQTGDYSKGTGGRHRVRCCEDINGQPGQVLAETLVANPLTRRFDPIDIRPEQVEGRSYLWTYENLDSDPTRNFVSINNLATVGDAPGVKDYPKTLKRSQSGGSWSRNTNHVPSYRMTFADGFKQGALYDNVPSANRVIGTARQLFTPPSDFSFSRVGYSVRSGQGTMRLDLRRNGVTVASFTDPYTPNWNVADEEGELEGGVQHELILSAQSGAPVFQPLDKGPDNPWAGAHAGNGSGLDLSVFFA